MSYVRPQKFTLRSYSYKTNVLLNDTKAERIQSYGRIVAKLDNVVVKIDHNEGARDKRASVVDSQTKHEIILWRKIAVEDRKYFPEMLGFGLVEHKGEKQYWLAERYYPLDNEVKGYPEAKRKVKELIDTYHLEGDLDGFKEGVESRSWNWAIHMETKQPIIYDFGFNGLSGI